MNGSQLFASNQTVSTYLGGGSKVNADGTVSAPTYTVQKGTYNDVGTAIGAVDSNLTTLYTSITDGSVGVVHRTATPDVTVLTAKGGTAAAPGAAQKLTNLAAGTIATTSTDAVNGSQLFATNQNIATQTTTLANVGTTTASTLGGGATYDPATGKVSNFTQSITNINPDGTIGTSVGQTTVAGALDALDKNTTNLANNLTSGTIGPIQRTGTANQLALVAPGGTGAAPGAAQTLTNVAAGAVTATSTEAINGSQLRGVSQSMANSLGGGSVVNPDGTVSAPTYTIGGNAYNNVGSAMNALANGGATAKYFHANSTLADGQATGTDSIAIGPLANAIGANSIAQGNGATANGANGIAMGQGITSGATGQNVAIGSDGTTANAGSAAGGAVAIGRGQKATGNGAVAIGDPSVVNGTGAVVVGADNTAAGNAGGTTSANGAVAIGNANTAIGQGSVALGNASSVAAAGGVALGDTAKAQAGNGVALGSNTTAANANDVALGSGSATAAAVGTTDTKIGGTTYTFAGTTPGSTVSVGSSNNERTITNVAAGRVLGTSTDAVNGSQLFATNQAINAVTQNTVQYDLTAGGTRTNTVTLKGGDPNAPVLISNVKAGVADTDAANVGQVKQASAGANNYTDIQVGAALQTSVNYTQQVAAQTLQQANSYTDMRFGQLSQQIGDVQKEARQAAAIGLAASSLRYDERPGKLSAAVGGGVWKGYAAGSMGLGYTSKDQNVRANVSATTTGDSWGIGAGLSFTLN